MNGLKKKSEIVIFAGPNGSGKSTFTLFAKTMIWYPFNHFKSLPIS